MFESTDDLIKVIEVKKVKPLKQKLDYESRHRWGKPDEDCLKILIELKTMNNILIYSKSNTSVELGGLLLGNFCKWEDDYYLKIDDFIPARNAVSTRTSIYFSAETWNYFDSEIDSRYPNGEKRIVGWFHTHPGFGVFVSDDDKRTHMQFQSWWQVALVIDPTDDTMGIFMNKNNELKKRSGFYIYSKDLFDSSLDKMVQLFQFQPSRRRTVPYINVADIVPKSSGLKFKPATEPERNSHIGTSMLFLFLGVLLGFTMGLLAVESFGIHFFKDKEVPVSQATFKGIKKPIRNLREKLKAKVSVPKIKKTVVGKKTKTNTVQTPPVAAPPERKTDLSVPATSHQKAYSNKLKETGSGEESIKKEEENGEQRKK
jgi:proteasome lid subunit RPN8/RPN11